MAVFTSRIMRLSFSALIFAGLISCSGTVSNGDDKMQYSADFESGNLPKVTQLDQQGYAYELALNDDNGDSSLPNSFRTWWYFRIDQVPVQQNLHFEFSRLGFPYYFVPVYSYDGKNWQYFDEQEVTQPSGCDVNIPTSCRIIIDTQFTQSPVWLARTFPYTTQDLSSFLTAITANSNVKISTIGYAPSTLKPLQLITIADDSVRAPRQTVWIHARAHAAETGPSFLLEGLIGAALRSDSLGQSLLQQYIFKIMPMQNIDGIVVGNYRTNTSSINLENQWLFDAGNPYLNSSAPSENRQVNQMGMVPVLLNQSAPVTLALNLHSSNSDPDTAAFFFPHFGSDQNAYTPAQQNLWNKQLAFIKTVAQNYHGRIEQPPDDGGAGFLNAFYPETWWWANLGDSVNAITLETTYGRAGYDHWITENDLRYLGEAVARSIADLAQTGQAETDMSVFRLPYKPEIYQREPE